MEVPTFQCPLRRKLTEKWNPPELCFGFDWKMQKGDNVLFLCHIRFYFRVARLTYFSPLPKVDKERHASPTSGNSKVLLRYAFLGLRWVRKHKTVCVG